MVEEDWLSPEVIGSRLERVTPSALVRDWLADPERVRRLGGPVRGLLRRVARLLTEEEVVALVQRTIQRHVQDLPAGPDRRRVAGARPPRRPGRRGVRVRRRVARPARRPAADGGRAALVARSLRALAPRRRTPLPAPRPAQPHGAAADRRGGVRVCRLGARRRRPATRSTRCAGSRSTRPARFAERLAAGDPETIALAERVRASIVESLESGPLVRDTLARLRYAARAGARRPARAARRPDRPPPARRHRRASRRPRAQRGLRPLGPHARPTTCCAATIIRSASPCGRTSRRWRPARWWRASRTAWAPTSSSSA